MSKELTDKSLQLEKQILEFIEQVRRLYLVRESSQPEEVIRWAEIAKTELQQSFMALRRSIDALGPSDNKEPATSSDKEEREINIRWEVLPKKEINIRFCWSYLDEEEVYCTDIEAISVAAALKKFKDIMAQNHNEKDIFVISYDVLTR